MSACDYAMINVYILINMNDLQSVHPRSSKNEIR